MIFVYQTCFLCFLVLPFSDFGIEVILECTYGSFFFTVWLSKSHGSLNFFKIVMWWILALIYARILLLFGLSLLSSEEA